MTSSTPDERQPGPAGPSVRRRIVALFEDVFQLEFGDQVGDIRREDVASWDSFNHVQLVTALEEQFDIALGDEEVVGLDSLSQVETLLFARGVSALPPAGA